MAKDDCGDKYQFICKDRFDELGRDVKTIIDLLRGHNSDPGVLDDLRELKKWREQVVKARVARIALATAIALIFVTQVAILLRDFVS